MSEKNTDSFNFHFLRTTGVNILSNIMVPLAGAVDTAFLGHLTDIYYLAGVALATIIFIYTYRTCKFLRMGTTGATAQAEGSSDKELVLLILLRNVLIALTIGFGILAIQYPIKEFAFAVLSASSEDVKIAAIDYYNARIWGAPATLSNFVLIGWLLGREKNNKVLLLSLIGNGGNILLDYLFVFHWNWNSAGAGFATATSQYLMLLAGLTFIAIDGSLNPLPAVYKKIIDLAALKTTIGMNFDIWVRSVLATTVFALFIDLSASWGTLELATNALLLQVVNMTVYFIEGSAFTTESLAGNFRGQGFIEKLLPLLKLSIKVSLSLGIVFTLIFVLLPGPAFRIMTNHLEVIDEVRHYVLWLLPILLSLSLVYVLEGYFLGLTEVRIIRNSMIAATVLAFIPTAAMSWWFHNIHILWLALFLFSVTRIVTLGVGVPKTLDGTAIAQ
ncbi:MAG: MATE family efflux transporter [Symploca sp. SIO1B1]|nr:MATE family efflux transporter [Symploca sp. SIO1B1]